MAQSASAGSFADRIETIETTYEFMLAYAAQGRQDEGDHATSEVRALLTRAAEALNGIGSAALEAVAGRPNAAAFTGFVDVLAQDAAKSLAAFMLVLSTRSISSALVDNLNGSIHLRALLTDIFVLDEAIKERLIAPEEVFGMSIGFIGLGVFGGRIATRLVHEGLGVMIFDRVTDAVRYFMLKNSADVSEAPRTIGALCEIACCVLPSAADVRAVALGRLGLADGLPEGKSIILIDLGASSSLEARALADELLPRGIIYVEAPAYGAPADARDGKLVIPVGCDDPATFDQILLVLKSLSGDVSRTGAVGSAHVMGALAEQVRAAAMLAAAEALTLGRAAGVDPAAFVGWCESAGLLGPAIGASLRRNVLHRTAASGGHTFSTVLHGLDTARALAAAHGLAPRQLELLTNIWREAMAARGREADHAEIARWLESVTVAPEPAPEA